MTQPFFSRYENGCACGERHELEINYEGDVRTLHALGFDGLKLDGWFVATAHCARDCGQCSDSTACRMNGTVMPYGATAQPEV